MIISRMGDSSDENIIHNSVYYLDNSCVLVV